jgi:hypothetical protein
MDAVRALFNDTSVLELDNTNVSEYLEVVSLINSRLAACMGEIAAYVSADGFVCNQTVHYWNKKGRECFDGGGGGGDKVGSNMDQLSVLGTLFILFGDAIRPKTKTSYDFLTRTHEANLEYKEIAQGEYLNILLEKKIPEIGLQEAQTLATSQVTVRSRDEAEKAKAALKSAQEKHILATSPSSSSTPFGDPRGTWKLLGWPTGAQGDKETNEDGTFPATFAMLHASAVKSAYRRQSGSSTEISPSALPILKAAISSDADVKKGGKEAKEARSSSKESISSSFSQGSFTLDWTFAHMGQVESPCGFVPTPGERKSCSDIMAATIVL